MRRAGKPRSAQDGDGDIGWHMELVPMEDSLLHPLVLVLSLALGGPNRRVADITY
jgi:hypothetical protein